MSSKAIRKIAAILLIAVLTAFTAAPPAGAIPDWTRRRTASAGPGSGYGIIAFLLLRLILKTGGTMDPNGTPDPNGGNKPCCG